MLQTSIDTARINLFASLVKRGAKSLNDVPVEDRKAVEEAVEKLKGELKEGEFEETPVEK